MVALLVSEISSGNITDSAVPINIVNGTYPELIAYLVLHMWPSHFGLPLLILTILLSKNIQRHPVFVNMLIVWTIDGLSSSLLAYAGKTTGPEPSKGLCLFQASMLYATSPTTSMAVFTLVFQTFLVIRANSKGRIIVEEDHAFRLWTLLAAPYCVLLSGAVSTAIIGALQPEMVSRDRRFFYCSVMSDPLTNTIMGFSAVLLISTILLEVWTVVILYNRWRELRRQGTRLRSSMELGLPIRIITFVLYMIIALSLSLLSFKGAGSPIPDLTIATAATFVILIFGTQPDILRVFCFWRKDGMNHSKDSPLLSKSSA